MIDYIDEYINTVMFNDNTTNSSFNNTSYNTFKGIIQRRFIYSIISICFCLFIVISYIILCIQVCLINKNKRNASYVEETYSTSSELKEKVGLGNHFMFSVIVSNILASVVPIIFYVVTYEFDFGNSNRVHMFNSSCPILGFLHNYLDLISVCWVSALMNLFYKSTIIIEFKKGEEIKQYIYGLLYSVLAPLVITLPPFLLNKDYYYGYADSYCSLNYNNSQGESVYDDGVAICKYAITFFVMLNLIVNLYQLIKVIIHYRKRLQILKEQQNKEYKVIRLYVIIFICFPIHLIITRLFKTTNRLIGNLITEHIGNKMIIPEISSFVSCTNGCITSLLCCYFFRNVYTCKIWNKSKLDERVKDISMKDSLIQSFDEEAI